MRLQMVVGEGFVIFSPAAGLTCFASRIAPGEVWGRDAAARARTLGADLALSPGSSVQVSATPAPARPAARA